MATEPKRHKLSASALSTYLKSPKSYYFRYIAKLDPLLPSAANFDHDKIFGILWAEYVDRFYKGVAQAENTDKLLTDWDTQVDGWVPSKKKADYTKALQTLAPQYYQEFSPKDGVRTAEQSEMKVENETFLGYLDGLSEDKIIHEVKTASRSPQLAEQLWKVQHSLQVRLYAVLAQATGVCIEFGFKDSPYAIFRAPVMPITAEQRAVWELELNALAAKIYSSGDDPNNYPCHPDGCCMTTRFMVSMCPYQILCDTGLTEETKTFFKPKKHREEAK